MNGNESRISGQSVDWVDRSVWELWDCISFLHHYVLSSVSWKRFVCSEKKPDKMNRRRRIKTQSARNENRFRAAYKSNISSSNEIKFETKKKAKKTMAGEKTEKMGMHTHTHTPGFTRHMHIAHDPPRMKAEALQFIRRKFGYIMAFAISNQNLFIFQFLFQPPIRRPSTNWWRRPVRLCKWMQAEIFFSLFYRHWSIFLSPFFATELSRRLPRTCCVCVCVSANEFASAHDAVVIKTHRETGRLALSRIRIGRRTQLPPAECILHL